VRGRRDRCPRHANDPVTYVNAPQRARDHGLELREISSTISDDYVNLVTVRGGGHSISGTLHWRRSEQRIVLVDGHTFDVPPVDHMVMITNDDRPGVIGTVGTLLGNAGINIADMDVGRSDRPGLAVMLIAPTSVVEPAILDALRAAPGIVNVVALNS
jgi:D-3-phosphoglycerate dehydrogenase / 2-oxoglutarate reductase